MTFFFFSKVDVQSNINGAFKISPIQNLHPTIPKPPFQNHRTHNLGLGKGFYNREKPFSQIERMQSPSLSIVNRQRQCRVRPLCLSVLKHKLPLPVFVRLCYNPIIIQTPLCVCCVVILWCFLSFFFSFLLFFFFFIFFFLYICLRLKRQELPFLFRMRGESCDKPSSSQLPYSLLTSSSKQRSAKYYFQIMQM